MDTPQSLTNPQPLNNEPKETLKSYPRTKKSKNNRVNFKNIYVYYDRLNPHGLGPQKTN